MCYHFISHFPFTVRLLDRISLKNRFPLSYLLLNSQTMVQLVLPLLSQQKPPMTSKLPSLQWPFQTLFYLVSTLHLLHNIISSFQNLSTSMSSMTPFSSIPHLISASLVSFGDFFYSSYMSLRSLSPPFTFALHSLLSVYSTLVFWRFANL